MKDPTKRIANYVHGMNADRIADKLTQGKQGSSLFSVGGLWEQIAREPIPALARNRLPRLLVLWGSPVRASGAS